MNRSRMTGLRDALKWYADRLGETLAGSPAATLLQDGKDDKELVDEICARLRTAGVPGKHTVTVANASFQVVVDPTMPANQVMLVDAEGKATVFNIQGTP